jgi:hypothetical protein
VRDVAHQSALVLALALATLLTRCLGEEAARTILNPPPRAGRRRPRHARDRLFRVGRDRLWQRLWQDEPPAITWELVHVDAPNWSTACWQSARPAATPVHRTGRVGKRARLRVAAEGNSMHMTRLFCPPLKEKGVGGSLRGRCFGKPLRAISRFSHQEAQTPPSPLVEEGARGDKEKRASGCGSMLLTCRCDHRHGTGAPDPSPALRAADRLPLA